MEDQCQYIHNAQECKKKDCSLDNCSKRHPKPCYFWENFGKCKLGTNCAFKHKKHEKKCQYNLKSSQSKMKNKFGFKHEEVNKKKKKEMKVTYRKNVDRDVENKTKQLKLLHEEKDITKREFMDIMNKFSKMIGGMNTLWNDNHEEKRIHKNFSKSSPDLSSKQ